MSVVIPDVTLPLGTRSWKWWVCGLLLLATTVNYMDRLTLNLMSKTIMDAFQLNARDYGMLESAFGTAFAFGAIVMGWVVDRWKCALDLSGRSAGRGRWPASPRVWSRVSRVCWSADFSGTGRGR